MPAEYQLTLPDYLSILRRRAWSLGIAFIFILALAIGIALLVPPVFESTATILVESQQIPTELIQASNTGFADERIEVIKQRVLTRDNLLHIINKYGVFDHDSKHYTPSEMIDEMRSLITVETISADLQGKQQGKSTIAFKLSFDHRYPELAYKVANELVTLFLEENVKARTERATETTEFLADEANKLKLDLEKLENAVATYKQQNGQALPEHAELRMDMVQRTESELKDVEREYKSTQAELHFLDIELASAKAGMGATAASAAIGQNPAQELEQLKSKYAEMATTYKETHPDLQALKRKIAALETGTRQSGAKGAGAAPVPAMTETDLITAKVHAKINAANASLASLAQQQKSLHGKIGQLEHEIIQSPQVERGLIGLLRDHDNAKRKYEEVRAKQMNAQMAENLESEKKAERFALLEPPLMPDKPIKPDRKKMVVMGFFLALAGSGGMMMALETIDKRLRGTQALTLAMGQSPLVVIPYITTQAETRRRKYALVVVLIAMASSMVLVLLALQFFYMPLDLLLVKVLARLN